MDTQLQQLRDAVKAVAKARAEGRPIDLSALPPEIRQKIQAQLDKLPPDARQQLQGGMAKVEGAAHRAAGKVTSPLRNAPMPTYHGHFNNTIQPGDASRIPVMWIVLVGAIAAVVWKLMM